jgi:nucleoside-diphosphate-sugar epimerase
MGGTYMKILVLGSEGVIGSSLCKYLESCGHEIIRWDIKLTNDSSNSRCHPGDQNI